jgi:myo-inositol-1(or 4)-monophosphatase
MLPDVNTLRSIIAGVAADEALPRFQAARPEYKLDGSVVTETDRRMQDRLHAELQKRWPEYAFLGEEMSAAEQRAALERDSAGLWCLDPLDGTSNFASGLPFFAVSLALLVDGRPRVGIVYDPIRNECFSARDGEGAFLNSERLHARSEVELRRCIACVDFKRLPGPLAGQLASAFPYMSQRNIGASALDWCWLASGRFQVYIHGGQKLWDYAAGALVLQEAGGLAATLEGEQVFSARLETRSVVAAVTPHLFEAWKRWVDTHSR